MWCILSPSSSVGVLSHALHNSVWKNKERNCFLLLFSEYVKGSNKVDSIITTQREYFPQSLNQAEILLFSVLNSPLSNSSLVSISQSLDQNVSHTGSLSFSESNQLFFVSTFLSKRGAERWLSKSHVFNFLQGFVINERIP